MLLDPSLPRLWRLKEKETRNGLAGEAGKLEWEGDLILVKSPKEVTGGI